MKRIFNFILVALCVISYTSCNDDEGIEYIQQSSIKIISRDVTFPAAASQGSIVVEAPGAITVTTSDKGWCTTSVSGSTIQVSVEQNPGLEGRNSMLTIRCGNDTTSVAIIQSGVIFQLSAGSQIMANDEAGTYSYDIKCNTELSLTPSEDWITVAVEDGKMNVTLAENNTGHIRKGNIAYSAGTYKDVINVTQCDFNKDLAGQFLFASTDPSTGESQVFNAILGKIGNGYSLELPDVGLTIPVIYNQATGELILKAGQYVGDYGPYKLHTVLWDTNAGYLTWSTAVSMSATFEYTVEEGVGYTIAFFEDDGSWGTYHPNAVRIEAFSSTNLSSDTRKGLLITFGAPYLLKAHSSEETTSYRVAKNAVKSYTKLSLKRDIR